MRKPAVYMIELRMRSSKTRIHDTNRYISRFFGVPVNKKPHVTLFGPFILKYGVKELDLLSHIARGVRNFDSVPVRIEGFDTREGVKGHVIAHRVDPGPDLLEMKKSLIGELPRITRTNGMGDRDIANTWFHVTIAKKLSGEDAGKIWQTLSSDAVMESIPPEPGGSFFDGVVSRLREILIPNYNLAHIHPLRIHEDITRVSVLKGSKIFAEYDLEEKRWV